MREGERGSEGGRERERNDDNEEGKECVAIHFKQIVQ